MMDSGVFFVAQFPAMKNTVGGGLSQLSVFGVVLKSIPDFLFSLGKQSFPLSLLLILRSLPLTETGS
ncbi:hypothetical protein [Alcaligenes phenolicus]|uniref:hypothetical protein n=1 Tax=Alcaligenes TaxID=507 RepID=UPI001177B084|nr:hypothetical protein [Alcaligenes phenolicus]